MIFGFFQKEKHPLPKFPPNLVPIFRSGCETLPKEDLYEIKPEIKSKIKEMSLQKGADQLMLEQMERAFLEMIDVYEDCDDRRKSMIVGAIRYCFYAEDAIAENHFMAGFLDDVKVINHVLEKLSLDSYYVKYRRK